MKKLLLSEPIVFLIVLTLLTVCPVVLFIYSNQDKKIALVIEQIFVRFFLLAGIEYVNIFSFSTLHLSIFITKSTFFRLAIWPVMALILSNRVIGFFRIQIIPLLLRSIQGNPFIWMLILLSIMSSLWSDTPLITLKAAIVLAIINIFSIYLVHQHRDKSLNLWRWNMTVIGFLSILIRRTTNGGGLAGVLASKNALGSMMALNTVWWIWQGIHNSQWSKRLISFGIAATSFNLMLAADSAGAKFTFLVLLLSLLLLPLLKKFKFRIGLIVVILFIIISSVMSFIVIENLENIFSYTGKDLTLTGRTYLWGMMWNLLQQRLWFGYGLYGFWQNWRLQNSPSAQVINMLGWEPPHSHQGFLDVSVDLGLVGLILIILSLLVGIIQATWYLMKNQTFNSIVPLILLIYVIMANISESRLLRPGSVWFILVLVTVKLSLSVSKSHIDSYNMNLDYSR